MVQPHVLLVTFPAQGHINPSLQFAKRLIEMGIEVTFTTSVFAHRRMAKIAASTAPKGLNLAAFSDGFDDGFKSNVDDSKRYMSEIRSRGSQTLRDVILKSSDEGRPVTSLVYTLLLPWAAEVARELHIPSALLWIQPATVLDIYYYYFNGYEDEMKCSSSNDPNWSIQLPRLPLLKSQDLPSFLVSSSSKDDKYSFALPTFKEQLDTLDGEENPKVLVNTFDALELEPLKAIEKYNLIGIGPLIPSSFLGGKDSLESSFGGDLFQKSNDDYMEWLNTKPKSSIVYISFGSLLNLSRNQKEEIAKGLIEIQRPFLWVIRDQEEEKEEEKLSCMMELEKQGKIVPWCSQLEVLTHPSLGCFVSHCGWNSTLESLSSGVPVVAFPHWTDQGTNAKLIEDVWKTGVRMRVNEDGVVESDEIKRCIEIVMDGGEKGEEMRKNAQKWKELARAAVKEGGSSEVNLKAFVLQVSKSC
ncbi:UDP-glycosyltransferase 75C1 [Solanum lycopersicum]|uniref:UDP-glycosyltransferase 75C1 n=1 Tax=Solanum lycopersicum TaxID=4081 RepID=U75C1_SOLLC|nr:UDP-glycosyltransferase 75C1 [Solanum lycopersicum]K4CWS6.1 RecName: Full=UDP-glycosyltransferase 75C1; Short=Abscisic acid beta-glucosyltransferase; Short=Indole-3-acetate beta-glucosyltransferase; Short=SlUGT75C1 [Solanum lycopersicum]